MLTVVCKATFVLMPVVSPLAPEQDEPNEADGYWNDEETRSLNFASDLAPFKRRADVLVVGHAFAPERRPVGSLVARVVVGEVDKAIAVFGDRAWTPNGQMHEGPRFVKMPLRWERAAGGPGTANPVGVRMGSAAVEDRYGAVALPNLQAPGTYLASPADVLAPVGFGPLAPRWSERVEKLYRHAAGWEPGRWNERPVPDDIDAGYFNAAPGDQQVAEIRSGERVVLENLHADHARLVTNLSQVEPRAVVERAGGSAEVRLRCDTLWIDTDRGRCSLVWRGQVLLGDPREAGRVVVTASVGQGDEGLTATVVGVLAAQPAMPFGQAGAASPPEDFGSATVQLERIAALQPLPFREGQSPLAMASVSAAPRDPFGDGTGTMLAMMTPGVEALPFARGGGPGPLPMPAPPAVESFDSVAPPSPEWARAEVASAASEPAAVAPPAMVGPLATVAMAAMATGVEAPSMSVVEPEVRSEPPVLPEPAPLPLDKFSLERCAAIAASMARTKTEAPRILERNELSMATWEPLRKHWAEAIREEVNRGKATLLERYDIAYVAQIEKERGTIGVDAFAKLLVAKERGGAEAMLKELALPTGVMLRLERVWLGKIAQDAGLSSKVSLAVELEREG